MTRWDQRYQDDGQFAWLGALVMLASGGVMVMVFIALYKILF